MIDADSLADMLMQNGWATLARFVSHAERLGFEPVVVFGTVPTVYGARAVVKIVLDGRHTIGPFPVPRF